MSMDEYGYYDDGSGFAGADALFDPELLAMQNYMMGAGFDPSGLDPAILQMLLGANPGPMNKYGEPEPFDTSARASGVNLIQDIFGSTTQNPMFAYLGGPGSYAPGALDPVMDESPVQMMGETRLRAVASRGGVDGLMAKLILGLDDEGNATADPMSASAAAATVRRLIEEGDPEAAALAGEIPQITDQFGQNSQPDWGSLAKRASELEAPLLDDMAMQGQPDMMQRPDGSWVQVTQRPSPQMEWLQKMGLPDPRARYDVEYAFQNDPMLQAMMGRVAETQAERDAQRESFASYLKKRDKERDARTKQEQADQEAMDRYSRRQQGNFQDFFSEAGRRRDGEVGAPQQGGERAAPRQMSFEEAEAAGLMTPMMRAGVEQRPWVGDMSDRGFNLPELPGWLKALSPQGPMQEVSDRAGEAVVGALTRRPKPELELEEAPQPGVRGSLGSNFPDMIANMQDPTRLARRTLLENMIPEDVRRRMNFNNTRRLDRERNALTWEKYSRLAPILNAGRAGRTPAADAIAQRLAPLFAAGG